MLFWSPLCGQNENASQNVLVCDLHSFIPKGFSVVNAVVWSHHMHLSLLLCPLPSLGNKDGSVVQYWSVVLPWAFPRACSISNGSEVFGCVCVCVWLYTANILTQAIFSVWKAAVGCCWLDSPIYYTAWSMAVSDTQGTSHPGDIVWVSWQPVHILALYSPVKGIASVK